MHKSEPNTLNHFQGKFRLNFSNKFSVIIDEEQARKQSLFFRFEKTSAVLYFRFLNVLRAK
jgi:hypothetical protein